MVEKTTHTRQGAAVPRTQVDHMQTWRWWWDQNIGRHMISRADGVGGVVIVKRLETRELDAETRGRFWFAEAELICDGRTFVAGPATFHADKALLRRLRSYAQIVHIRPASNGASGIQVART